MNHVLDGVHGDPPTGRGNFEGCPTIWIASRVCCGVCSKRHHSVVNNGMTAGLLQPTAMLPTGRFHITLSPMKNLPRPRWGLLSKLFDRLFVFIFCCSIFRFISVCLLLWCWVMFIQKAYCQGRNHGLKVGGRKRGMGAVVPKRGPGAESQ